jgi:acetoin utilization deacetylase AcuC-like enzyme
MGFCLLNNIAVAAGELLSQGERVLILDWDVHHGNGTQAIFWDDPNVLYVSLHQWPLFPGSGRAEEVGGAKALDRTVNIPLPPGATGDVFERALSEIVAPIIDEFKPTWVLVSAGFDAHRDDQLAELQLTSGDFAQMARFAKDAVAGPGRLALFLEGGYDLVALRSSIRASLGAVLGGDVEGEGESRGGAGLDHIERVQTARQVALDNLR